MKKFLLILAATIIAFGSNATNYKGLLTIVVAPFEQEEGEEDSSFTVYQEATITVTDIDGKYEVTLNNFVLDSDILMVPVGNIVVPDPDAESATPLETIEKFGYTVINFEDNITIKEGSELPEGASAWYGPMLGKLLIKMNASFNDRVANAVIDIPAESLGLRITVNFIGENPDAAPQPQGNKYDVNGDNAVDVGDVNAVLEYILNPTE